MSGIGWVIVWIVVSFINFGALNAKHRSISTDRATLALSVYLACCPVIGTVLALFGTGFFEHGLSWRIGAAR